MLSLRRKRGAAYGITSIGNHLLELVIGKRSQRARLMREILVDALRGERGFCCHRS
jgi:hypothetical protein